MNACCCCDFRFVSCLSWKKRNCRKNGRLFVKLIALTCVGCLTAAWDLAFSCVDSYMRTEKLNSKMETKAWKGRQRERSEKVVCKNRRRGDRK